MKVRLGPEVLPDSMHITLVGALVDGKPNYIAIAHLGIMDLQGVSIGLRKTHHPSGGIKEIMAS